LTSKYTLENPTLAGAGLNQFQLPPIDVEQGYDGVGAIKPIAWFQHLEVNVASC